MYVEDRNIYLAFTNDKQKQITFNGSDEAPILLDDKKQIVFVRSVKESNTYTSYERKKLMIVSIDDLIEKTITEKKPFKDGRNNSNEIFNIGHPTISIDKNSIYFTTEKWATGDELVKVNINDGEWTELFAADNFEYITKGVYKRMFLISRSEIRDKGRAVYHMLVNEKGAVKKEFENKTSAMNFMKTIENK